MKYLIISIALIFSSLSGRGQILKVMDGAHLKTNGGVYLKLTGMGNANLQIDTGSSWNSNAQITLQGNFNNTGTTLLNGSTIDCTGNWYSFGSGTQHAGTSKVTMSGSQLQNIRCTQGTFYDLEINNSYDTVALLNSLPVTHEIRFTQGNLFTGASDTILLNETGTLIGESSTHYVIGRVLAYGTVNASNSTFGNIGLQMDGSSNAQNLGRVEVLRTAGLNTLNTSYTRHPKSTLILSIDQIWDTKTENAPTDSIDITLNWLSANDHGNSDWDSVAVLYKKSGSWKATPEVIDGSSRTVSFKARDLESFTVSPYLIYPILNFTADTVCFGNFTSITDLSYNLGLNPQYQWDFETDGTIDHSLLGNINYTFSTSGNYTATLYFQNTSGVFDTLSKQILVKSIPMANFAADSVCLGTTTTFTDLSISNPGSTYTWDFDGDGLSDNSTPGNTNHIFPSAGGYQSILTITDQGCSDTDTFATSVWDVPTVNAGADQQINAGSSIDLTAIASGGTISTYLWSPATDLSNTSSSTVTASPISSIHYTVTVTNSWGCSASDEVYLTLLKSLFVPTGFTPDGDGVNDSWEIPDLQYYPEASIEVYDRAGQNVFTGDYDTFWNGQYKGNPSPAGSYFFVIEPGEGIDKISGQLTLIRLNK